MKYQVTIPVETVEMYEVEAESEEEAKELVGNGEGEPVHSGIYYEADTDSNNWTVETVE